MEAEHLPLAWVMWYSVDATNSAVEKSIGDGEGREKETREWKVKRERGASARNEKRRLLEIGDFGKCWAKLWKAGIVRFNTGEGNGQMG